MRLPAGQQHESATLVDLLDRVLDKGLVVAGDVKISLANVELLTIKIRLLVCSIDKAEQIGLNWWRYDQSLVHQGSANGQNQDEIIARLEARIAELEQKLALQSPSGTAPGAQRGPPGRTRRRPQ